jgi:hypothetical protein
MPPASTRAALTKMFKDRFFQGDLTRWGDIMTPFGDLVAKKDDFYGNNLIYPFNYGDAGNIYPSLDATNPVALASKFDKWVVDDTTSMYGRLTLDIPSMMRSDRDVGSYLKLKTKETLGILRKMKEQRLGVQVWGDGACDIGRTSKVVTAASPTIDLTNQGDAVKFKIGMRLQANPNRTGNAGTLRTDVWSVTKVERLTATGGAKVTVARISGAADDWAINDYIYNQGFYDSAMKGIQAWVPATTPSATLFFGMDRSDEPEMKAGWRGIWQGSIRETILHLVSIMGQYFSPQFSSVWLSPANWFRLSQELLSIGALTYNDERSREFGTKVITFAAPGGDVSVASDPFCPNTDAFLLRHGDIEIVTTGPLIHLANEDVDALRLSDSDGLEIRYRSLAQMIVPYPFHCGRAPIV